MIKQINSTVLTNSQQIIQRLYSNSARGSPIASVGIVTGETGIHIQEQAITPAFNGDLIFGVKK